MLIGALLIAALIGFIIYAIVCVFYFIKCMEGFDDDPNW